MKIITAIVTPFDEKGQINYSVFDELMTWQIKKGADGVVVGGTTGEFPTLTDEEITELYSYSANQYHSQINIYLGVGTPSTSKTVKLIKRFDNLPIQGFLVVIPYYNLPPQKGIIKHFELIAKATNRTIIIYNVPKRTSSEITITSLIKLLENQNINMIKDASKDKKRLKQINKLPKSKLYLGDDSLFLWGLKNKIEGIISVISNVDVDIMKRCIYDKRAYRIYKKSLNEIKNYVNPIGIKKYLRRRGYEVGTVRLPLLE